MTSIKQSPGVLEDVQIPVKLKLSAAWAALMFLYAYGDVFAYFRPGFIQDVMAGEVSAFEINQLFLLAISIYVAISALSPVPAVSADAAVVQLFGKLGGHRVSFAPSRTRTAASRSETKTLSGWPR